MRGPQESGNMVMGHREAGREANKAVGKHRKGDREGSKVILIWLWGI